MRRLSQSPKNITRALLQPIIASKVLEKIQIDLVDMRLQQNGDMQLINHLKYHFSKFNVLYAMPNKKALSVAKCLECYIAHVGMQDIL